MKYLICVVVLLVVGVTSIVDKQTDIVIGNSKGRDIVETQGCVSCHSIDGSKLVAPSFKGLYGSKETLSDGSIVLVNDSYIKESILIPSKKVVKGYNPIMPPYVGILGDGEIKDITEYIKGLK